MKRSVAMVAEVAAFRNGLADLDIGCDSIPPVRIEISLAVIRCEQYPTDHTHLERKWKWEENIY